MTIIEFPPRLNAGPVRWTWWTEERIEKLKCYWAKNLPASYIARMMGCTRNSIIGKAHRLELLPRKVPPQMPPGLVNDRPRQERRERKVEMKREPPLLLVEIKEPLPETAVCILDVQNHHCRFIVGSSNAGFALFCGADKQFGSYCAYHARQCYHPHVFGNH